MRFILLILSICVFVNGLYVGTQAQSAAQQVYAAIQYLIAAVLFGAAAICSEIAGLRKRPSGEPARHEPAHEGAAPAPVDPDGSPRVWLIVAILAGGTLLVGFALAYAKAQGWIS
jgi:hypothetical protein